MIRRKDYGPDIHSFRNFRVTTLVLENWEWPAISFIRKTLETKRKWVYGTSASTARSPKEIARKKCRGCVLLISGERRATSVMVRFHMYSSISRWSGSRYPSLSFLWSGRRPWRKCPHIYPPVVAIKYRPARISCCRVGVFPRRIISRSGISRRQEVQIYACV